MSVDEFGMITNLSKMKTSNTDLGDGQYWLKSMKLNFVFFGGTSERY